jgi:CheY-specific phosphatase CheX
MNPSCEHLPEAAEIAQLVEQVVWAFVGENPQRTVASTLAVEEGWTGCVLVEGRFHGAVTVACTRRFARRLAGLIFEDDRGALADAAARDALAEFTNVVGGNVKSLISEMVGETCMLGLPVVATGEVELPRFQARRELHFACGEDILCIDVLELAEGAVKVSG